MEVFIEENVHENVSKKLAILSQPQYVNLLYAELFWRNMKYLQFASFFGNG